MKTANLFQRSRCALTVVLLATFPAFGQSPEPKVATNGTDKISVTWNGGSGSVYFLMTTDSLGSYSWKLTHGPLSGNGADLSRIFDRDPNRAFFRVSRAGADYFTETDYDKDGIPSAWEVAHNLDPTDPASAAHDPDRDGRSALAEYLEGTDPGVKQSDSVSYLYDAKGRLTQVIYPGGKMIEYQYDSTGNLTRTSMVEF